MFGFRKKKDNQAEQQLIVDEKLIAVFKESNENFTNNIAALQKIEAMVKVLDKDLAATEKNIFSITEAINLMNTRLAAIEDQLSVTNIKFTNN